MPTGYTAGIIDGTIKTFKEYATQCMRAFGAAIHMRDDSMSSTYKPREVDTYHQKRLQEDHKSLLKLNKTTDEQLLIEARKDLEKYIEYHKNKKQEVEETKQKLESFLQQAEEYVPPTEDHEEYKMFLKQQLTETIKWVGNSEYHDKEIADLEKAIQNLSAVEVRKDRTETIQRSLNYHSENWEKELIRVKDANRWVEDAIKSLQ
jgi:vacuolar-type H+-ATPase subunit I/STV1